MAQYRDALYCLMLRHAVLDMIGQPSGNFSKLRHTPFVGKDGGCFFICASTRDQGRVAAALACRLKLHCRKGGKSLQLLRGHVKRSWLRYFM